MVTMIYDMDSKGDAVKYLKDQLCGRGFRFPLNIAGKFHYVIIDFFARQTISCIT